MQRARSIQISILVAGALFVSAPLHAQVRAQRDTSERRLAAAVQPRSDGTPAVIVPSGQSIADVAAKVTPSVVSVLTERAVDQTQMRDPFEFFFGPQGPQFGQPGPQQPRQGPRGFEQGLGSGVIVSSDGVIMTNAHVVADAEKIRVVLNDGRELDAKLVGSDPQSDVAVLRVNARGLTPIQIADSSKLRIGDVVLAIGNPFGVGQTVTMGIISAVGRANVGIADYEDFIQTDAAINPGNSGGALVSMDGQLVGIPTAIVSRSGGFIGIGFAIPSSMALQIKDAILREGKVVRGWLGVAIQNIGDDLAKSLGVQPRSGVLISDVTAGSPAAKAGLKRGDIVTAINGREMTDSAQLRNFVALSGKNKAVKMDIMRNNRAMTLNVTLGEKPAEEGAVAGARGTEPGGIFEGVTVQSLDRELRERLDVPSSVNGVVVTNVDPGSAAARTGLQPGDVIVEMNRKPVTSMEDFRRLARASGERALLLVFRNGVTTYMSLSK